MAIQFSNTGTGSITLKPATSGSWSYTLPQVDGSAGYYLGTNGSGSYQWVAASPITNGISLGLNTATPNTTVNVSTIAPTGGTASMALAWQTKAQGYYVAALPDGTTTGGDARAQNTWDMQQIRTAANQGTTNQGATFIFGGINNRMGANTPIDVQIIAGGETNAMLQKGFGVVILGGKNNQTGTVDTGFGVTSSSILSGQDHVINHQLNSAIMGRGSGPSNSHYQVFVGSDGFVNSGRGGSGGECQTVLTYVFASTSNTVAKFLELTSSLIAIYIRNKDVFNFFGYVIANNGTVGKTWLLQGAVKRGSAGSATVIGSTITMLHSDTGSASWNINSISINTANTPQTLGVTVQNTTTGSVDWLMSLNLVMVNI